MNKLMILQVPEDMLSELYDIIGQYPKAEKYSLGEDTKREFIKMYRNLISASKKKAKLVELRRADVQLAIVKRLIRIGYEKRFMTIKRYESMSKYITNIGNMIGGWINQQKTSSISK